MVEPEPEFEGKSVQPQAPGKSNGSGVLVLNQETGASFCGVPAGDEADKARYQLLLQSGGEKNTPKTLRDGSSLTAKFNSYPSDDVVEFLDSAESQLKYVDKTFWHVYVLKNALGTKVLQMAKVHQKALLPGRMPARMIQGELCVIPGGNFAHWKEMKAWLLLSFAKPEKDLMKMEKIHRNNSQGKRSFGEYASTLILALKQCRVQTPDHIIKTPIL